MEKTTTTWSVQDLESQFLAINFPEYQREPNIWSRAAKQRLVDSMTRQFDIASLYFYEDADGAIDCIDGRQRINAIMAFLGKNSKDEDNGFDFRILNEIYEDEDHPFETLQGLSFSEIQEAADGDGGDGPAGRFVSELMEYRVTVVKLSGVGLPEEFNLQFTRLNLGTIINAGEKLHAMVGAMRDVCFEDERVGKHPFLEMVSIPTRRFAKEQVAAQVLAQVFSMKESGQFTRTRHFDLQKFFKRYAELGDDQEIWIEDTRRTFDSLAGELGAVQGLLRNRAITVSTVLLAWKRQLYDNSSELGRFGPFLAEFLGRLRWQVKKGLDAALEYRYLIDFQRHVTQASVEKPAVEARATTLEEEFERWLRDGELQGDAAFRERTGEEPLAAPET